MRQSLGLFRPSGAFFRLQFSAGYTINMFGFDFRHGQVQNAFIESFNGRLRDEFLNETLFTSLMQARQALEEWRCDYNQVRPHSSLGWLAPAIYASQFSPPRGQGAYSFINLIDALVKFSSRFARMLIES